MAYTARLGWPLRYLDILLDSLSRRVIQWILQRATIGVVKGGD